LFESNREVIEQAADRQSMRVGAHQAEPQGELCQQLLNEIALARFRLLDPQQKAIYDSQLTEELARRGERTVASPPPAVQQSGVQPLQGNGVSSHFGPPPAIGLQSTGQAAMSPTTFPASRSPSHVNLPEAAGIGAPAMTQIAPSSMMPATRMMPNQPIPPEMAAPRGFLPTAPHPPVSAAVPIASPLPVATARMAVTSMSPGSMNAPPTASPSAPPAAPQRPMDELASLAAETSCRRRVHGKKRKETSGSQVIIVTVVAVAAALLLIVFFVVRSQDTTPSGYDAFGKTNLAEPGKKNIEDELRRKAKEIVQEKEKKTSTERAPAKSSKGPVRPLGVNDSRRKQSSQGADNDIPLPTVREFGRPSRTIDSPDPGSPGAASAPINPDHRSDLGDANDPVFEIPSPNPKQ